MSRLRADNLTNRAATGAPLFTHGASVTGVITATSFNGSVSSSSGNVVVDPATQILEIRGGGSTEGQIQLNCSFNSHGQKIIAQPHSEGVTNEMLLPKGGNSTLVSEIATQTLTNKTFSGNGANITDIDAGNISAGIVTTARLGSGTASADTFLNGDGEFKEAGGGSWEYISSVTASNSATMEFTSNIDSTYDTYVFVGSHLIPTVDSSFLTMQYYDSGADWALPSYGAALRGNNQNTAVTQGITPSTTGYFQTTTFNAFGAISNLTARGGVNFVYYVFNPSNTTYYTHAIGTLSSIPSSTVSSDGVSFDFTHQFHRTQAVTGVRFRVDNTTTGNIASGTIRMYGIKNS